jgi:transposase
MFLGLDISKLNFDAALLDPSAGGTQAKPRHKAFPNTPAGFQRLQEWLDSQTVHACLEATGTYGDALARFLHDKGHTVSVVNPARIKAFGGTGLSRTKTDKADAILIARFCSLHRPSAWTPPPPEAATLQALVRRLETLGEMRQMEQNRLDVSPDPVRASVEAVLLVLEQQIEATRRAIRDHIDGSPGLKAQRDLLVSIPGVAETTAAALLAEIVDVSQFAGARQVAAFAGLVPRIRQSGSSVRGRSSLSKVGSRRLRHALYFPAMVALRFNPPIHALGERLKAGGKSKMVMIGAAMRKLLQIAFGVLKSGRPFDAAVCAAHFPAKKAEKLAHAS